MKESNEEDIIDKIYLAIDDVLIDWQYNSSSKWFWDKCIPRIKKHFECSGHCDSIAE